MLYNTYIKKILLYKISLHRWDIHYNVFGENILHELSQKKDWVYILWRSTTEIETPICGIWMGCTITISAGVSAYSFNGRHSLYVHTFFIDILRRAYLLHTLLFDLFVIWWLLNLVDSFFWHTYKRNIITGVLLEHTFILYVFLASKIDSQKLYIAFMISANRYTHIGTLDCWLLFVV